MNFSPLLEASLAIQIHVAAAFAAMLLGAAILFRRKGDHAHRLAGRIWVALMALVALSSFFIWTIRIWGLFSPIHLLSAGTLFSLAGGVGLARMRNIIAHKKTMQFTYVGALILTGFFTLLPGRIMYAVFFGGEQPLAGAAVLGALVLAGVALVVRSRLAIHSATRIAGI